VTQVFIGGSRTVSRLNEVIRSRLSNMIEANLDILIGDANGADKVVQSFFADRGHSKVTIYCVGSNPRNNIGNWDLRVIEAVRGRRGFEHFAMKDRAMARDADVGFMLWDGKSRGTLHNIFHLLDQQKKVVVYLSPTHECVTLSTIDDLASLVEQQGLDGARQELKSLRSSRLLELAPAT
jgi:hypothetical protein